MLMCLVLVQTLVVGNLNHLYESFLQNTDYSEVTTDPSAKLEDTKYINCDLHIKVNDKIIKKFSDQQY